MCVCVYICLSHLSSHESQFIYSKAQIYHGYHNSHSMKCAWMSAWITEQSLALCGTLVKILNHLYIGSNTPYVTCGLYGLFLSFYIKEQVYSLYVLPCCMFTVYNCMITKLKVVDNLMKIYIYWKITIHNVCLSLRTGWSCYTWKSHIGQCIMDFITDTNVYICTLSKSFIT